MSCPICNHTNPDGYQDERAENCPQCGSDLEVFTHIESAQKEHQFQKKSMLILAALLGIVVVSWGSVSLFSGDKPVTMDDAVKEEVSPLDDGTKLSPAVTLNEFIETLKKENQDLKSEVASLLSEVASLKSEVKILKVPDPSAKTSVPNAKEKVETADVSNEGDVIIHVVKRGESLWKISKKYFRNGTKAKKIAADNNLTKMRSIPVGTKLKIYK